jgi:short subunit dehydrogenase-like uncharacterized protein
MITLFGATGYTGQLAATALDQAGLPFRIAGRSGERLELLSKSLNSHPDFVVVDIGYAQSVSALFQNTKTLINCVGPFTDFGEKILSQAAINGVHYLDSTNELGFVYRMQSYQRLAQQTGAAIVPACAFEVALADCAVRALSSSSSEAFDVIHVVYHLKGQKSSPGTRRSALRSLATSWVVYRDGRWIGQAPGTKTKKFSYQGKIYPALATPSSESVTFPAHTAVKSIDTWMTLSPIQAFFAPAVIPYFARFLRSIAGPWLQKGVSLKPLKPEEQLLSPEPFQILIFTHRKKEMIHTLRIMGTDPYGITAKILVQAAMNINQPDFAQKGVLPPSAILGGQEFFDTAQEWGISLQGLGEPCTT